MNFSPGHITKTLKHVHFYIVRFYYYTNLIFYNENLISQMFDMQITLLLGMKSNS